MSADVATSLATAVVKELAGGGRNKAKSEEEGVVERPFVKLQKSAVMQECRAFHDANFVKRHPKRCCQLITKLLCLLTRGETLSGPEATEVFFGVTKLFQSTDGNLRRMVYLFIKEVVESTNADEIIIVVQSLCKDMTAPQELYRANALRVLAKIINNAMLGQLERLITQAIVDSNALVASSALIAGMHLISVNPTIVRRWVNEVQNSLSVKEPMVQFHALALLRKIKETDRLAVVKLVTQLRKSHMRSDLAVCMLIRYSLQLLKEDMSNVDARGVYEFFDQMLRHPAEMVNFEAAKAICSLPGVVASDLQPAVSVLQHMFITSPKPVLRFAAIRTLNKLASTYPAVVAKSNTDIQGMISDPNRSIATLAVTTLLKTGNEASVETLLRDISSFMADNADEHKIEVVQAIHDLSERYPNKQRQLFHFLGDALREEGGFVFKKTVLDALISMIKKTTEATALQDSLLVLCDFIEDCEFPSLSARVLHLLGDIGPTTTNPSVLIRYVHNRTILEQAQVRAAAVAALGKFAARVDSLRPSVELLIRLSLNDEDDEVRDRAVVAIKLLEDGSASATRHLATVELPMSVSALSASLRAYLSRPSPGPVSFATLPRLAEPAADEAKRDTAAAAKRDATPAAAAAAAAAAELPAIYKIAQFKAFGGLIKSTAPVALTESELEYLVSCTRHVFEHHVVFEFIVNNTLPDQVLIQARVEMDVGDSGWDLVAVIPAPRVIHDSPVSCYVAVHRTEAAQLGSFEFPCQLRFMGHDADPDTNEPIGEGFEETVDLENVTLGIADMMVPMPVANFKAVWMEMGNEVVQQFALEKKVHEVVANVGRFLGMEMNDGTGAVGSKATTHSCLMSGTFLGTVTVLGRLQVAANKAGTGSVCQFTVRSTDASVSTLLAESLC